MFCFRLGEMNQIHIDNSSTEMVDAVGTYMQVFNENITDMISSSFNHQVTEDHMMSVLDIIEDISKNRRQKVAEILTSLNQPKEEGMIPPLPSSWSIFLAITRYSSLEQNLNIKRLLENAAESVLVIPSKMYDVLNKLK